MLIRRRGLISGLLALSAYDSLRQVRAVTPHSKKLLLEEIQTYIGPGDLAPGAAGAYMLSGYSSRTANTTQCINLRRSSDSATSDFGLTNGNINQGAIAAWSGVNAIGTGAISGTTLTFTGGVIGGQITGPGVAAGTLIVSGSSPTWTVNISQTVASAALQVANTLFVVTSYDQSGNGNNATQSITGDQPYLVLNAINGRPAIWFTSGSAMYLAATGLSNIWSSGGWEISVASFVGTGGSNNRIFAWAANLFPGAGMTSTGFPRFQQTASSTSGLWNGSTAATGLHVIDFAYSQSSLSNVPTIVLDGVAETLSSTQPVGTLSTGTGVSLGGNGASPFNGFIAGWLLYATPSSGGQEAVRKNFGAYYGKSVT